MDAIQFEDRLEPLGILTGALLVATALGTLAGTPWTTANSGIVVGLQILGVLVTAVIGGGLVWLSFVDE